MSLFAGRKKDSEVEAFNPDPGIAERMPVRPYRVLYADLPFCSDPECKSKVEGACLIVLKSEDPRQKQQVQECMPTRKKYQGGRLVQWEINPKKMWPECWYKNPETGKIEKAWIQCVEFIGKVVKA
jgi:hypothetical protein